MQSIIHVPRRLTTSALPLQATARFLQQSVRRLTQLIARQFVFYFAFGCTQFVVDTLLLVGMTHAGVSVEVANPLSRAMAAVLGLLLNSSITFGQRGRLRRLPPTGMIVRYVVMWVSMTLLSTALIFWLHDFRPGAIARANWIAISKIGVEALLFLLGFLVSRYWVYRAPRP